MDILSFILGYNKGKAQSGEVDDAVLDEVDAYLDAINGETDVSVSGGTSNDDRVKYVTFMHGETELIQYPVIIGDTVKDVVAKKIIEAPTKEPTETIEYSFGGWSLTDGGGADSNALKNVVEDRTVYFVFKESARKYTVNFYDGEKLLKTEQVPYGGSSTYVYEKDDYIFTGWLPEPTNITADIDCYAQGVEGVNFINSSWANIKKVVDAGRASEFFNLGDTRAVTFTYDDGTSEDIEFEIVDFAYMKDDPNSSGRMAVMAKQCLKTPCKYADKNSADLTYESSYLLDYVGETLVSYVPADLQAVMYTAKVPFMVSAETSLRKMYLPTSEMLYFSNGGVAYRSSITLPCKTVNGTAVYYWLASTEPTDDGWSKVWLVNPSGDRKFQKAVGELCHIRPIFFI